MRDSLLITSFTVRKFLIVTFFVVVYLFAGGPTAFAHSGKQSYLYLSFYDSEITGRVELPVADLGPVLGIDFGTDGDTITDTVEANRAEITSYVDSHLALESIDGAAWQIEYGDITVLDLGARSYLLLRFEVAEDFDVAPRDLVVEFDAIIEANAEKDALLHIENDIRSAVLVNESDPLLGFSEGQTVQVVSLETAPTLAQLGEVRGLGTDGVRTGAVHVLFVGVLMAPVALLARRRGFDDPAPTVAAALQRAVSVLAAYAGGVFVALWLTGLGVVDLPSRWVVAATSVSLLAVSGWAVLAWRRPSVTSREPAVVAALGVLQGLGFGATFTGDNLDRSRPLLSLVGFTAGIVVGVAIVAALALLPMLLIRRTPIARPTLVVIAAVGAMYAGAWMLEGIFDADWSLDRFANPWRVWPRNLLLALVVAALAAGVRSLFAARDALRPVGSPPESVSEPVSTSETMVNA